MTRRKRRPLPSHPALRRKPRRGPASTGCGRGCSGRRWRCSSPGRCSPASRSATRARASRWSWPRWCWRLFGRSAMARRGRPWRLGATDVAVLALVVLHSISAVLGGGTRPRPAGRQHALGMDRAGPSASSSCGNSCPAAPRGPRRGRRDDRSGGGALDLRAVAVRLRVSAMRAAYERNPDGMLRAEGLWYPPGSANASSSRTAWRAASRWPRSP